MFSAPHFLPARLVSVRAGRQRQHSYRPRPTDSPSHNGAVSGRRRWPFLLLMSLLAAGVHPVSGAMASGPACGPLSGDGFHEISSADHLAAVGSGSDGTDCGADQNYRLVDNLTLSGTQSPLPQFHGEFDGGGFSISGLTVSGGTAGDGLFSQIRPGASVYDLNLIDVVVTGGSGVGGLAGENRGTVERVTVTGQVSGDENVGGLIGENYETISASSFHGTVTSPHTIGGFSGRVGGLVGLVDSGLISYSFSAGSVSAPDGEYVGGLVGWAFEGIENSYSISDVLGDDRVGGLVGEFWSFGSFDITNTFATGEVTGQTNVGGLIGALPGGSVVDSFWDVESTGLNVTAGNSGAGKTTEDMQTLATFTDTDTDGLTTSWAMFEDWEEFDPPAKVWGICQGDTVSYPYLLWEYESSPCEAQDDDTDPPTTDTNDASGSTARAKTGESTDVANAGAQLARTGPTGLSGHSMAWAALVGGLILVAWSRRVRVFASRR